jgi:hypothetical protein
MISLYVILQIITMAVLFSIRPRDFEQHEL